MTTADRYVRLLQSNDWAARDVPPELVELQRQLDPTFVVWNAYAPAGHRHDPDDVKNQLIRAHHKARAGRFEP